MDHFLESIIDVDFELFGLPREILSPDDIEKERELAKSKECWYFKKIGLKEAEDLVRVRGECVKIGIIDSGIDYEHKELSSSYVKGINLVDLKQPTENPLDEIGHGTLVASIIAGKYTGIVPCSKLYVVKVIGQKEEKRLNEVRIAKGIEWCIDQECDTINISLGVPAFSERLSYLCYEAIIKDILIVSAAGNKPTGALFPATHKGVISTGAIGKEGRRLNQSNVWSSLNFVAPGEEILGAYHNKQLNTLLRKLRKQKYQISEEAFKKLKQEYDILDRPLNELIDDQHEKYNFHHSDGTSFATAHLTGVLSLGISFLRKHKKKFKRRDLIRILKKTAKPIKKKQEEINKFLERYDPEKILFNEDNLHRCMYGSGLIRVDKFIEELKRIYYI